MALPAPQRRLRYGPDLPALPGTPGFQAQRVLALSQPREQTSCMDHKPLQNSHHERYVQIPCSTLF